MGGALDWVGLEWGPQGGLRAREVVLWAQLQREFRRRCLLPELAMKRLEAVGFCWDPQARHLDTIFFTPCAEPMTVHLPKHEQQTCLARSCLPNHNHGVRTTVVRSFFA